MRCIVLDIAHAPCPDSQQPQMKPRRAAPRLTGHLEVSTDLGAFLGDKRVRLLEAIEAHGSISQAAKQVPLSYKAAWDAVDAMNNLADRPLVERSTGGRAGGGLQRCRPLSPLR